MSFELYNLETAHQNSKPLLQQSLKEFGMIPNLHAVLAESPPALEAYQMLHQLFPPQRSGRRTQYHGPEFRQAERAFTGRRDALLWYRQHEDVILRYRRSTSRVRRPER